ncbi:MAG: tetratricopeptide repeat protein [Planctomycetota bacterium]|nr:tetratricopeptide repeat protein [Planctomycetota bacterium]
MTDAEATKPDEAPVRAVAEKAAAPPRAVDPSLTDDVSTEESVTVGGSGVKKIALIASVVVGIIAGGTWFLLRDAGLSDKDKLRVALELLEHADDVGKRQGARGLAERLLAVNYRDPDFAGGTEFVLGIAAFRDAEAADESSVERKYVEAVNYLRESKQRAIDEAHLPEWNYALGTSLHRIGASEEALPLLEKAVEQFPTKRVKVSIELTNIYLDLQAPDKLQKALATNQSVIDDPSVVATERDHAYLQRAQVLLAMGDKKAAEEALQHVSQDSTGNLGTKVFRAQTLMAEGNFTGALEILDAVAKETGLEETYPRQASYLMGLCAEKLGDSEAAVTYYKRIVTNFGKSHERVATNLALADLFRAAQRDEEAIESYKEVLRTIATSRDFRNRWISLTDLKQRILTAWNDWSDRKSYSSAIALAERMSPLFSKEESLELIARANHRWADSLEANFRQLPLRERLKTNLSVRERWRQSALAYAALANTRSTSSSYLPTLWTSAQHLVNAQDYKAAEQQLTLFLDGDPKERIPQALLTRGQVRLHLGKIDDAVKDLRKVIDDFPTDIAGFQANVLLGAAQLERNEVDAAENTWRRVLASSNLRPEAAEWRQAKFSLGRLLYYRARNALKASQNETEAGQTNNAQKVSAKQAAYDLLNDSLDQLNEYILRFPNDDDAPEARYMIATGLKTYAELPYQRYQTAETENARIEQRDRMTELLNDSIQHLRFLQKDLFHLNEDERLDDVGQLLLQSSYFEIAETHFSLARVIPARYRDAITAYSQAINKYPQVPRVLAAYLRMKTAYDRLGQPSESRIVVKQARVILERIPENAFKAEATAFNKQEWTDWLDVIQKFHEASTLAANAKPNGT